MDRVLELDAGVPEEDAAAVDSGYDAGIEDAAAPCPSKGGEMLLVPQGMFLFGQSKLPVNIPSAYCMDRTEVTAGAFNECVAAGGCEGYGAWAMCATLDPEASPNQCFGDRASYPANWIDWFRAEAFCRWAGKRLPRGAEWEKAARGELGATYPWGEGIDCSRAHFGRGRVFNDCLDALGLPNRPVPVGSYPSGVSPYGLLDMAGNCVEWVEFREDTTRPPPDGKAAVSRGGAYRDADYMVAAYAGDGTLGPGITTQGHGFRCAADLP